MKLLVISHKPCWRSAASPSGYATDGGFAFQMGALSELFDSTILMVPASGRERAEGQVYLEGRNLSVAPLAPPSGRGLSRKLRMPAWVLRNAPAMMKQIRRADAVHAPIPGDVGTIGMFLAMAFRKPLFVRHCGNWLRPLTTAEKFWKWFMERYAGGRNVMLATGGAAEPPSGRNRNIRWIFSTSLRQRELSQFGGRARVAHSSSPRLIIVCRQDVEKGTGVVIQALPEIAEHYPGATLDVVGDGKDLAAFRALATSLGCSGRVVFHGQRDHDGVMTLLREADLFCYPTAASEGFPKVALEALACETPVIATRVGGLEQTIRDGETGWTYLVGDEKALAACLQKVIQNPAEATRRARNGREMVRTEFDRQLVFDRFAAYLETRIG
jgi:hypothetical protein